MGIVQIIPADDWYDKKNDGEKVILTKLVCFALDASGAISQIPGYSNLEYKKSPDEMVSNTIF